MKHRITLRLVSGCWMAIHSDPYVTELFGTDALPTPFTAARPAHLVRADIQRLNPNCVVTLDIRGGY